MKKFILLASIAFLMAGMVKAENGDKKGFDAKQEKAIGAVSSSPDVVEFTGYMIAHNTEVVLYDESGEGDHGKGLYGIYVGENHEDHTVRLAGRQYVFDFPNQRLTFTDAMDPNEQQNADFNKLLLAHLEVDSCFKDYSLKPLTDCDFFKKKDLKAKDRAWASAENNQDHWVQATFDSPQTIKQVVLYWAWDKGKFYPSQTIQIFYKNPEGKDEEVKSVKSDNELLNKHYETPDCYQRQTRWIFSPMVTNQLTMRQKAGKGSLERPRLMWISQACVY